METENINQQQVSIQNPGQNQPIVSEDQFWQSKKIMIILTIIVAFFIFGVGGYFLGVNKNQATSQPRQLTVTQPPSTNNPISISKPQNNIQEYTKYQYNVFHIGTPVFQVQIPKDWSAYTEYNQLGKAQVVHFGES
ncbi:MAG: hypothetical protein Q7K55_06075 [Candidatus Levybacteria bacterium]|nr:hypothetical protein [Candidatus Levybacteria bacterium]